MGHALDLRGWSPKHAEMYASLKNKLAKKAEENKEAIQRGVGMGAATVTALSLGFIEGRYDYGDIKGMPMSGIAGVLGLGGAIAAGKGLGAEALYGASTGGFCVGGYRFALDKGRQMKSEAGGGGMATAGDVPWAPRSYPRRVA